MWCEVEEMVGGGCGGQRQPLASQNISKQQQEGGAAVRLERKRRREGVCVLLCLLG